MSTIRVVVHAEDGQWDTYTRKWELLTRPLQGQIPAPVDAECIVSPEQISTGDHVEVHARGSWYPGTVITIRKTGPEVEYTAASGKSYRKVCAARYLVPIACGLRRRCSQGLARTWADAVWAELQRYVAGTSKAPSGPCMVCNGQSVVDVAEPGGKRSVPCDACMPDEPAQPGVPA